MVKANTNSNKEIETTITTTNNKGEKVENKFTNKISTTEIETILVKSDSIYNNGTIKSGYEYQYILKVKNVSNKDKNNVKITVNTNDLFELVQNEYNNDDDHIEITDKTFTIEKIKAGEQIEIRISVKAKQPINSVNTAELYATVLEGKTTYRWRNRYDGTLESLKDKSRRPHSHPNQHTEEEIKLIKNYKRNNKDTGLVVLWIKLRQAGYTRTIQGLYHAMQRLGIYKKTPSKKKESEPNEWVSGEYPGDKVQIDVKYVPKKCMSKELQERGEKFYQYTAIDEYSRLRYTWFTNAHDTYASSEFAKRLVKYFPFKVKTIQTDNGFEFTNRLSWQAFLKNKKTMFEKTLEELGIEYKVIKPHTPKQNGRVERSHRKDQERFYYKRVFYSLEDLRNQGKEWRKEYNNFPMRPLGWLSPREFIEKYKSQEESLFTI